MSPTWQTGIEVEDGIKIAYQGDAEWIRSNHRGP